MPVQAIFDRGRREMRFFSVLAAALVVLRSAVFLLHGYIDFDSDQAIVGLMAKHLSEFRRFPLFFYGQNYMLGVQAWLIAPFFWVARPSVAVLKTPILLLNVLAAVVLVRSLSNRAGLRPAMAFVAAIPFIVPTPVVSGVLTQTLGTSGVEPLLYILFLWMLRQRPFAFGALLAFGFLHREFTMYALPAVVLVELGEGAFWSAQTMRRAAHAAAGFALVWLVLDDAKLHLNGGSLFMQARQLSMFMCLGGLSPLARAQYVFTDIWPVLSGGREMPLDHYGLRSAAVTGSVVIGWVVGITLLLMLIRLAWLWRSTPRGPAIAFAAYLALVGFEAVVGYSMTCSYAYPVVRYFHLALLFPIGCFAAFAAWEPSPRWRTAVIAVFLIWGAANTADSVRMIRTAYVNPQPDPHGELTAFLLSHQIRYARAKYWDAYALDFLSRERIIIGSWGPVRIPEYEDEVDAHRDAAVNIERMPCEGQWSVAGFCIQVPVNRPGQGAR